MPSVAVQEQNSDMPSPVSITAGSLGFLWENGVNRTFGQNQPGKRLKCKCEGCKQMILQRVYHTVIGLTNVVLHTEGLRA